MQEGQRQRGGELGPGQAIEIVPGQAWSIGSFEIHTAGEMSEGFQLVGQTDDGREVTFTFMPGEARALGGLISEHTDNIEHGMAQHSQVLSPMPPVHIRTPGGGPETIPTNRNVHSGQGTPES